MSSPFSSSIPCYLTVQTTQKQVQEKIKKMITHYFHSKKETRSIVEKPDTVDSFLASSPVTLGLVEN
jgi:hypothetical protein